MTVVYHFSMVANVANFAIKVYEIARRGYTISLKRLMPRAPNFGGPQNFRSKENFQHFVNNYICIVVLVEHTFSY